MYNNFLLCFLCWALARSLCCSTSTCSQCQAACGVLAPGPGIKPTPSALANEVLTIGPPGQSQQLVLITFSCAVSVCWPGQRSANVGLDEYNTKIHKREVSSYPYTLNPSAFKIRCLLAFFAHLQMVFLNRCCLMNTLFLQFHTWYFLYPVIFIIIFLGLYSIP